MRIYTTRFGNITVSEDKVISFPEGIVGFEDERKFVLLDFVEKSPMKWLQSITNPSLAFVVCDPWHFFKDYDPKIGDEDMRNIQLGPDDEFVVFAIVTVPSDVSKTSLNLLSPIIVNSKKMIGKQIILYNSVYKTRHYIFKTVRIDVSKLLEAKKEKV